MSKPKINHKIINKIFVFRKKAYSIKQISDITNVSISTVHKYTKDLDLPPKIQDEINFKRNSSHIKSKNNWKEAEKIAKKAINKLSSKDMMVILACLYWCEGSKKDLNFINSDPEMISLFVKSLIAIGVTKDRLVPSVRVYTGLNEKNLILFWSKVTGINMDSFKKSEFVTGGENIKLNHGMCRIRVTKPSKEFKLINSLIKRLSFCSSMDRITHS